MSSKLTYVFDTSIFVYYPHCLEDFPNADLIIPIAVLEELDKLKTFPNEVGRNARITIKELEKLEDLHTGSLLSNGSTVRVEVKEDLGKLRDAKYADNRILACALGLKKKNIIVVSRDYNLRLRSKANNLGSIGFDRDKVSTEDLYTGFKRLELDYTLNKNKELNCEDYPELKELYPNQCVYLEWEEKRFAGRKIDNILKPIKSQKLWNLESRSLEQGFATDLLCDPKIPLVTLTGAAGTGKSVLSVAAGLQECIENKKYRKFIIYKPIQTMGETIGYLPGPQPLDAKIATPDGWTTMGEIKIGDNVIARDGSSTKVLEIYPKGTKSVFRINTTDGTSTECCDDHLWYTHTAENIKRQKPGSVKSTKEISESIRNKNGKINHFLPRNEAVQFTKKITVIPPYLLGTILGDGCSKDSTCVSNTNLSLIERVKKEVETMGCEVTNNGNDIIYNLRSNLYNNKPARPVKITNILTNKIEIYPSVGIAKNSININKGTLNNRCDKSLTIDNIHYEFLPCEVRWQNPIKNELFNLGLFNKKAWEKFIPDIYKYNSIENRISLIRGLMDTDGTIKKNGEASFCTTSRQMALDIIEMVRSLGGRATLCTRNRVGKKSLFKGREIISRRISYEFTISLPQEINPFYIEEKAKFHHCSYIHKVGIESIDYIGEKQVQCIKIDNQEHLYLTNDFIVTHNTMAEKISPYLGSIMDAMELLLSSGRNSDKWRTTLEMYKDKGIIEVEDAVCFIRGRSIQNSIILLDEAQNISKSEIKTILTRIGQGSKIIITGDTSQIDNPKLDVINNGLTYAIEALKHSDLTAHIHLTKCERSAISALVADNL